MVVKERYFGYILILSVICLSGCYNEKSKSRNIFHYNEYTGIASLDPAFAKNQSTMWPAHQLFNTLVEVDANLNMVPSLATHWEVSDDRRVYTFHLRNDVFFHDNEAFPNGTGRRM